MFYVFSRAEKQDCSLFAGVSATFLVLLALHAGDQVSDTEVLGHLSENIIVALDVFNLDLRFLGDEVHLSLTFLL